MFSTSYHAVTEHGSTSDAAPTDAGMIGLRDEVRELGTPEIVDQLSAMIEAPDWMYPILQNRIRFCCWALQERFPLGQVERGAA